MSDTLFLDFYNSHDYSVHKEVEVSIKEFSVEKLKNLGGKTIGIKADGIYLESGEALTKELCSELKNHDCLFIHDGNYVMGKNPDTKLDICIAGPGAVGKSSITLRLIEDTFFDDYNPTVEDLFEHEISIDGCNIKLTILDMAGQEDFRGLATQQMRGKHGYIFVYSLIMSKTFEDLQSFYQLFVDVTEDEGYKKEDKPFIIVGNKCDLYDDIEVSNDMIKDRIKEWNPFKSFKTSAKTGENVRNMIGTIIRQVINTQWPINNNKDDEKEEKDDKSCCCTIL